MTTIDLKCDYCSLKSDGYDTRLLKFICTLNLMKFVVLPDSLSPGPRKFLKLTKPPFAMLRMQRMHGLL